MAIKYYLVFLEKKLMNYTNYIVSYQVKIDVFFRRHRTLVILTEAGKVFHGSSHKGPLVKAGTLLTKLCGQWHST